MLRVSIVVYMNLPNISVQPSPLIIIIKSSKPFHLIHSDIWGSSPIPNIFGAHWFVSFIDDCTRISWIFLLKHKSDVSFVLPKFHNMIKKISLVSLSRGFSPILLEIISIKS